MADDVVDVEVSPNPYGEELGLVSRSLIVFEVKGGTMSRSFSVDFERISIPVSSSATPNGILALAG